MNLLRIFWLLSFLLCYAPKSLWAQTSDQYVYTRQDSTRAYWTLQANYTDQTPVVQFYDAHHQLIYQEQLPPTVRYINKHTKRALDVMLASLIHHRVLASTYLNDKPGTTEPSLLSSPISSEQGLKQVVFRKGSAVASADPILSQAGKLTIQYAQLQDRLMRVSLEDTERNPVFEEYLKTTFYKRNLNLTQLPSGLYYLKLGRITHPFIYRLLVDQPTQHYDLQSLDELVAKQ